MTDAYITILFRNDILKLYEKHLPGKNLSKDDYFGYTEYELKKCFGVPIIF